MSQSTRKWLLVTVAVLFNLSVVSAITLGLSQFHTPTNSKDSPNYQIKWYLQTLDHFNFNTQPATFYQRYLVNDQFFQPGGPILFFTGNEGDITVLCDNSGFLYTLAEEFNGYIIFAEHRYYGESLPFGEYSFTPKNISYLSAEQGLADYATMVADFKRSIPGLSNSKVITFGGSYGGMLAAWFRTKYPHLVDGALASSAPVNQFPGLTNPELAFKLATQDFTNVSPACSERIRLANQLLDKLVVNASNYGYLSKTFSLCSSIDSAAQIDVFKYWLLFGLFTTAMTDYPYPTNFIEPLPAWPVKVSCRAVLEADSDMDGLVAAMGVYYNSSGTKQCFDYTHPFSIGLGAAAWNYQTCTEFVLPIGSNGVDDMFGNNPWDINKFAAQCLQKWGTVIRPGWIPLWSGADHLKASSNIIFSNGDLDPWHGSGVTENIGSSIYALLIKDSAHHLDLRAPDPRDPDSVVQARLTEMNIIRGWIKQN
jgi:lysosomal Pro-X carboxypeptidase